MSSSYKDYLRSYSRRGFLRQAVRAGAGSLAASAVLRDLQLISTASAQAPLDDFADTDFKALCCIFLAGGNDSENTIVPTSEGYGTFHGTTYNSTTGSPYANYASIRSFLKIKKSDLKPVTLTNDGGIGFALHPSFGETTDFGINKLFWDKKAAVLFNVGPLVRPVTKAEYGAGTADLPPQLYSHSDQMMHWQTSHPDGQAHTGWAGRMADYLMEGATNPGVLEALNTSLVGTDIFQTGASSVHQFNVAPSGAVTLGSTYPDRTSSQWQGGWHQALGKIVDIPPSANLQRDAYAGVLKNAMDTGVKVDKILAESDFEPTFPFPETPLGAQLKMVARMIAARGSGELKMKRQTFFVQLGPFDTHGEQAYIVDGSAIGGLHAALLAQLSDAVYAFQCAMEQLGTQNKVISFTASDFGRTLRSNGSGSDHGWGGHHFIFGGDGNAATTSALIGGTSYGKYPNPLISGDNSPDDAGYGRWIPSTSVDEYSATLARWFGVSETALDIIFPNLSRFTSRNLGFLR